MEEIKVVYEKGVFKPLRETDLEEDIKAVVVVRREGIADIFREIQQKSGERCSKRISGGEKVIGVDTFSTAFETGSRAIDAFYIAAAKIRSAILVSNDKVQVESAKKFKVEAYYLLEEFDQIKEKIGRS